MLNDKLFKRLEIGGGAFVFLFACFLHFFYDLSQGSVLGALFGAVNESVWEHIKIFALPYIIWATVELLWARPPLKKFVCAKALGVYSLGFLLAGFFYLYTALLGRSVVAIDITSGLVFSFIAHFISYKATLWDKNQGQLYYTGLMLLLLALIMIVCFTYYPPTDGLFKDPVTGGYGIQSTPPDQGAQHLDSIYCY